MDKIQTALQRFKSQSSDIPHLREKKTYGKGASSEQIIYTQTRSVNVPTALLQEQRILSSFQSGPFVESYKVLRTQVMHRLRENNWNVLCVTSPGKQEGKTLTAVNLAISLAMDFTQTVLLVDGDLRNPRLHKIFGLEDDLGLGDYLLDDVPLKRCLIHPDIGRFVILPAGRPLQSSSEVLTSPKMTALVEELKYRYASRIVIFDLPSLLDSADALAFVSYTDAVLLVVEEGKTTSEELAQTLQILKGAVPVLGTVLNKADQFTLSPKSAKQLLAASIPFPQTHESQGTSIPKPRRGLSVIKGHWKKSS